MGPTTTATTTLLVTTDDTASVMAEGETLTYLQRAASGTGTGHPQPIHHRHLLHHLHHLHPHRRPFIQPPPNPLRCPFPTLMGLLTLRPQANVSLVVVVGVDVTPLVRLPRV